ncbi:MAG: transcription termination/antitermination NusG family protein [Bacteroidales bacterium]|nr:transcription termination/antitermination NusG family protein [Bacteroidales bacterium]
MDTTRVGYIVVKEKELDTKWYAVYTRPRFEKQVLKGLLDRGIKKYFPIIKTMQQWPDRIKVLVRIQSINQNLTVEVHSSLFEIIRDQK